MCGSCDICPRKIYSNSVTLVGTTLVIDIPAASYHNCQTGCLIITQSFPAATTLTTPVAISIGGVTTPLYPVIDCAGNQITAAMLKPGRRYPFVVTLNSVSGSFKIVKGLFPRRDTFIDSIPVPTT
jgi:hypothetical protein